MVADFVDFLIRSHALEEKYREDSIYGLTLVFEKLIVSTVLFMLSLLLGKFWEGVLFTVCFLMLRQATGGFHAKSFPGCFIGSIATVVLTLEVFLPLLAKYKIIFGLICIISIFCILLFAPVNHPDLMLTLEEQRKHRNWSRGILFMEIGAAGIGTILKMKWQQYILMAIIICAVFIVIAKLIRQEVRTDENKENRQSNS
jgi:accessory gene regulator B